MKLLVISHTPHYKTEDGKIFGWGPTIRELNHLTELFSEIYHIAPLHDSSPPASSLQYVNEVRLVPIRPTGGDKIIDKLDVVFESYHVIKMVNSYLKQVDCFQFRAPTGIGVFLIPWLSLFSNKKGWFKYAGNWVQENAPWGYSIQRFFLKSVFKSRLVTINGAWPNQQTHLRSFENPCLTTEELSMAKAISEKKNFDCGFNLLFVGRIEEEKGVGRVLEMVSLLSNKKLINEIIFIGPGSVEFYKNQAERLGITSRFIGEKTREELNEYYEHAHLLLLPSSASEGFPKVIAEAAAFGCVPMVSSISSVGHYINNTNGLVFSSLVPNVMANEFESLCCDRPELKRRSKAATRVAVKFTYPYYTARIKDIVSSDLK